MSLLTALSPQPQLWITEYHKAVYWALCFFLIYVNDIPNLADFAKFILYADDANIILTANTIEEINEQLEKLIFNFKRWVNCNGLALNLKKINT